MRSEKHILRIILEPLAIASALAFALRSVVTLCSVPSASMAPTLQPGDLLIVTRYWHAAPAPGEVVVFRNPAGEGLLVKRVVATAGDFVEAPEGTLRIGGHTVPEPYLRRHIETTGIAPRIVAAESYYVLGDNRSDSIDSRVFGEVQGTQVLGRARWILWSRSDRHSPPAGAASRSAGSQRLPGLSRFFKCIE